MNSEMLIKINENNRQNRLKCSKMKSIRQLLTELKNVQEEKSDKKLYSLLEKLEKVLREKSQHSDQKVKSNVKEIKCRY